MQIVKHLFIASLIVLLSNCGSTPTKPDSRKIRLTLEQLPSYLEENDRVSTDEMNQRRLNAVEFLISKKETDWAHSLIKQISLQENDDKFFLRYMLAQGRIAIQEGEPYLAQRYLFDEKITQEKLAAHPETGAELLDTSATLQYDLAEYMRAFDLRVQHSALISDDEISLQLDHDLIWETLAEIPASKLFSLSKQEPNPTKQGWLSLAALSKSNGANYRAQITDIRQWQNVWPEHPANLILPADLQLILQLSDQQAIRIAVMLPLSGKLAAAGQAIRDGFLAGYYDDAATAPELPRLSFHDTVKADINTLYANAVENGVQLVVGPLLKENVYKLSQLETLNVPVLALNTLANGFTQKKTKDTSEPASEESNGDEHTVKPAPTNLTPANLSPTHTTLYQFTLAVETEAEQVAFKAWKDGHRKVSIVAPSSAWGDRSVHAFRDSWLRLGGEVIEDRRFKDQRSYSSLIESSVSVDKSKLRKRQLQQILGKRLEFEPRSRRDIDFIFMPSYSHQAKQLKPLLAFHYAGDIPVYAMSQVYNGENTQNLSDLNGIKFSALPWFFDKDANEKRAIEAYAENNISLQHFYAMGVDAYHIYPRLEQLKLIQQAQFYGHTGKLSVAHGNIISREQTWAEIRNGMAIELKSSIQTNDTK